MHRSEVVLKGGDQCVDRIVCGQSFFDEQGFQRPDAGFDDRRGDPGVMSAVFVVIVIVIVIAMTVAMFMVVVVRMMRLVGIR
jgi:hypothetical protein